MLYHTIQDATPYQINQPTSVAKANAQSILSLVNIEYISANILIMKSINQTIPISV